jgi:hypothetical protein
MKVRGHLEQAQQHYKAYNDKQHRELEFKVDDWVWLHLLNRSIASLEVKGHGKLGPKFYGPFRILGRVGLVAYKLELPPGARHHHMFHVGLLKPYHGATPTGPGMLPLTNNGRAYPQPAEVIKGCLARGRHELLVRWTGQLAADATWVELATFKAEFASFQLEDKLNFQAGRDVMTGIQY